MMTIERDEVLDLLVNALEQVAFVFVDPCELEDCWGDELSSTTMIDFEGDGNSIRVYLCADEAFLRELAAGMLGIEEQEVATGVEGHQALDELANILGGELILALGGSDQPFQLGLPTRADATPNPADGRVCLSVESEQGHLGVLLS